MKSKLPLLALFFLMVFWSSKGQETQPSKTATFRVYKIWIDTMDSLQVSGFFEALDSTGITISNKVPYKATDRITIPAENIKFIKMRRKGSVLKGVGYGTAAGAVLGSLSTAAVAEDSWLFSREDQIAAGGIVWGTLGGIIGALVGTKSKKMEVNGKAAMYHLKIPIIEEMVYGKVHSLK